MAEEDKIKKLQGHYLSVFTSPSGEIVLQDLKESFQDRPSFDETNPIRELTDYREGQRSVYLKIEWMMEEAKKPEEES